MTSGPITSWEKDGETVETVSDFNLGAPESLQMVTEILMWVGLAYYSLQIIFHDLQVSSLIVCVCVYVCIYIYALTSEPPGKPIYIY